MEWYSMIDDDLEVSRQEAKRARDERLAKEKGMIRLFTVNEEDIMKKGFVDVEEE